MTKEEKHEPIRQSVHVDCSPNDAFRLFTEHFGEWFPHDPDSAHEIELWKDGKIIERAPSGEERESGTVTAWEPPDRIEFTWSPRDSEAGVVEVEFTVEADGTRVTLTHTDWHLAHLDLVCFAGFAHERMAVT